ncbi:fasciclin domain-containing protein [Brevundimonas sp.]|uniref:fasciclin domain-containing protein n=1 Tax=Brevundimonas sp. TaxID=1871086 RepID=UPI002ED7D071
MLRTKLLTAAAATALLAAPAAFAQEAQPQPAPAPQEQPAAAPAPAATPAPAAAATPAQSSNVIEVLRAKGEFSTLLSALDQAQLTETLASRPAITIFAPTDAAFAALPEADRTRLLDPANAQELRTLLLYHVIVSDVEAGMITGARGGVQTAANNSQVLLDGTGDAIKVDGATVTQADLDASNGSVFVIDQVLNPATSQASMGDEEAMAPAAEAAPAPAATETAAPASETVRPSQPGETAPNGQQPATTTTVQSPPVQNPTDGQVDDQEDPANPAPTPTPN